MKHGHPRIFWTFALDLKLEVKCPIQGTNCNSLLSHDRDKESLLLSFTKKNNESSADYLGLVDPRKSPRKSCFINLRIPRITSKTTSEI